VTVGLQAIVPDDIDKSAQRIRSESPAAISSGLHGIEMRMSRFAIGRRCNCGAFGDLVSCIPEV
jgi:hypothetical protein